MILSIWNALMMERKEGIVSYYLFTLDLFYYPFPRDTMHARQSSSLEIDLLSLAFHSNHI